MGSIRPGDILWLPSYAKCVLEWPLWAIKNPYRLERYGHPIVIMGVGLFIGHEWQEEYVVALALTTLRGKPVHKKYPGKKNSDLRPSFIPIYPSTNPDTHMQLRLAGDDDTRFGRDAGFGYVRDEEPLIIPAMFLCHLNVGLRSLNDLYLQMLREYLPWTDASGSIEVEVYEDASTEY